MIRTKKQRTEKDIKLLYMELINLRKDMISKHICCNQEMKYIEEFGKLEHNISVGPIFKATGTIYQCMLCNETLAINY